MANNKSGFTMRPATLEHIAGRGNRRVSIQRPNADTVRILTVEGLSRTEAIRRMVELSIEELDLIRQRVAKRQSGKCA